MARPKAIEKRDRQINIALTGREHEVVQNRADAAGLRLIDYARAALLRRRVAVDAFTPVSTVDRLILEQWKRVGVNLNQMTRRMHIDGVLEPADLSPLLVEIRALVSKAAGDGA